METSADIGSAVRIFSVVSVNKLTRAFYHLSRTATCLRISSQVSVEVIRLVKFSREIARRFPVIEVQTQVKSLERALTTSSMPNSIPLQSVVISPLKIYAFGFIFLGEFPGDLSGPRSSDIPTTNRNSPAVTRYTNDGASFSLYTLYPFKNSFSLK
jgi:hypothetical protein